jgi:hypothetical protein
MAKLDFDAFERLITQQDVAVEAFINLTGEYSVVLRCLAADAERKTQMVDDIIDYLVGLGFTASTSAKDAPAMHDVVTSDAKSTASLLTDIYGSRLQAMLDDNFREDKGPISDETYRQAYELCLEVLADRDIMRLRNVPQVRDALDARDSDELSEPDAIDFSDEGVRGQILEMLYNLGDIFEPGEGLENGNMERAAMMDSFHHDTSRITARIDESALESSAQSEANRMLAVLKANARHNF